MVHRHFGKISQNKPLYLNQFMHIHLVITFLICQKMPSVTGLRNHPGGLIFMTGFSIICMSARVRKGGKTDRRGKAYTRTLIVPLYLVLSSLLSFQAYIKVLLSESQINSETQNFREKLVYCNNFGMEILNFPHFIAALENYF